MPDPTTLIHARKSYGDVVVRQLNEALLQKLNEKEILKHRKLRTDTTVVEGHLSPDRRYPATGWRQRGHPSVRQIASHAAKDFADRTAEVKEKILSIVKVLRRRTRERWEEVDQITQTIIETTEVVISQASQTIEQMQDKGQKAIKQTDAVERPTQLVHQAKQVVSGTRIIPDHMVSFFVPEARTIKKGKLSKETEFGYKTRIDETESGFVTGYEVYKGNPSDDELLVPAVEAHKKRFGQAPKRSGDRPWVFQQEKRIRLNGIRRQTMQLATKRKKELSENRI